MNPNEISCEMNCRSSGLDPMASNFRFWFPVLLESSVYQQGTCQVIPRTTHGYNKHTAAVLTTDTSIFCLLLLLLVPLDEKSDYSTK